MGTGCGNIKKSSEKAQPCALNPSQGQGGSPVMSREMQEGLACCTHSPELSCHVVPKPSPFLGKHKWIEFPDCTLSLYFQQRFRMEVAQMLGTAVNWQSSVGKLMFSNSLKKIAALPVWKRWGKVKHKQRKRVSH